MKYPYIKQQDQKDCGVTCLAMIFKSNGMEIPIHKLREISGTDLEGTSVKYCNGTRLFLYSKRRVR